MGIFDADVYGPSLPTMVKVEEFGLRAHEEDPQRIVPFEFEGVRAMSFGFAARGRRAVMRGPMVSQLIGQLVLQTNWGELDYLVIDMPPGTGDIQITLCQELPIAAALIVTTP